MNLIEKHRTGVPGLDVITHGGIPKGRSTLVCGAERYRQDHPLPAAGHQPGAERRQELVVAVEETPEDLVTTSSSLASTSRSSSSAASSRSAT